MRFAATRDHAARPVAVLSDASDFRREPESTVLTGLLSTAALLHDRTGMSATALLTCADNADELISHLRRVAPDFCGAYLVHTDPVRAHAAQDALTGALAVITEQQSTAVALVAAALTTLARAETTPVAGRLVIVGTERNPLVAALASAAGIGEIDSWGPDDAHNFPLHTLNRPGAVVVDLLGVATRSDRPGSAESASPVVAAREPATALLALPGLLGAAQRTGSPPGLAAHLACARTLVEYTPPGQVLPDLSDPRLADPCLAADLAGARLRRGPSPVR